MSSNVISRFFELEIPSTAHKKAILRLRESIDCESTIYERFAAKRRAEEKEKYNNELYGVVLLL